MLQGIITWRVLIQLAIQPLGKGWMKQALYHLMNWTSVLDQFTSAQFVEKNSTIELNLNSIIWFTAAKSHSRVLFVHMALFVKVYCVCIWQPSIIILYLYENFHIREVSIRVIELLNVRLLAVYVRKSGCLPSSSWSRIKIACINISMNI